MLYTPQRVLFDWLFATWNQPSSTLRRDLIEFCCFVCFSSSAVSSTMICHPTRHESQRCSRVRCFSNSASTFRSLLALSLGPLRILWIGYRQFPWFEAKQQDFLSRENDEESTRREKRWRCRLVRANKSWMMNRSDTLIYRNSILIFGISQAKPLGNVTPQEIMEDIEEAANEDAAEPEVLLPCLKPSLLAEHCAHWVLLGKVVLKG